MFNKSMVFFFLALSCSLSAQQRLKALDGAQCQPEQLTSMMGSLVEVKTIEAMRQNVLTITLETDQGLQTYSLRRPIAAEAFRLNAAATSYTDTEIVEQFIQHKEKSNVIVWICATEPKTMVFDLHPQH